MLERIARHNPPLNAIVMLAADAALARARAADEARARRESWGPFHGVPITIKDTFEVAGVTTTAGSASLRSHVPPRDAAVVARLKGAGRDRPRQDQRADLRLRLAELQRGRTARPTTRGTSCARRAAPPAAGPPRWPRGSAISSRAAIWRARSASRRHFCGIYGHKPSLDVVPMRGHIPPPPGIPASPPSTLPVAGPLARSAADLLAALEVLGGPDGDEARAWRWSLPPARGARLGDYRIGYVLDDRTRRSRPTRAPVLARRWRRCERRGRGSRKAGRPA
jgi:amidase